MGRANRTARVKKKTTSLLSGWKKELKKWRKRVWVGGKKLNAEEIIERLTASRSIHENVDRCRLNLAHAIAARDQALAKEQVFQDNLETVLRQEFGPASPRLSHYGLGPLKRRGPVSTKTKVIAKAQEKATRAERGTLGKRQRLAITTTPKPQLVITGLGEPPSPSPGKPPAK